MLRLATLLCLLPLAAQNGFAGSVLVSGDFKNVSGTPVFSGNAPDATTYNSVFGGASVWNDLYLGDGANPSYTATAPSFSTLLGSAGEPTPVGLRFSENVHSYTGDTQTNNLFKDFIYLSDGSLDWTITGMAPGAGALLYFFNYGAESYRTFNMWLDTNGDGTLDGSVEVNYLSGGGIAVQTSADGAIAGRMDFSNGQPSWSGFEVYGDAAAPEPASWFLLAGGFGLAGLLAKRQRTSNQ